MSAGDGAPLTFPAGFVWGAASSAYQIEGGIDLDGRVPSIWDTFSSRAGAIRNGDDGRVAADHRRRWRDDVALLADLGIAAYRFSVAWPRQQLDFYSELVDELLARGVEPVVTLYHWDLPQSLEDEGGWPARATAERLADHAAQVGSLLGDRVRRWTTVNEPWCASMLGYASGVHAPGRHEPAAAVAAAHHLLLGHAWASEALRATVTIGDPEIGITLNPYPVVAAGERPEDLDAARRIDGLANRWWEDALLEGRYPDDVVEDLRSVTDLAFVRDGDLARISAPMDALGVNYYRRHHVRHATGASASGALAAWPGSPDVELVTPPGPVTSIDWSIEPDGLTEALVGLHRRGAPPLYVHETGAAFDDHADPDGVVDDQDRIDYLRDHLHAAHRALVLGVDLRGVFEWTTLDNFEWAEGYAARFGLVHVDFDTQVRTPKRSATWYGTVCRTNVVD